MQVRAQVPPAFNNIPAHDYLGILHENKDSQKKIVNFLHLTKEDLARATGIAKASIRYDERMPSELSDRLREIGVICGLVAEYFKGDIEKTALWFKLKNPLLGDISPRDMIRFGRYQKLVKFIRNALAGNTP